MEDFWVSGNAVGAIIEIARQMAEQYVDEAGYRSGTPLYGVNLTSLEEKLSDLLVAFQTLRDGQEGHDALAEMWDDLHSQIKNINPDSFYG